MRLVDTDTFISMGDNVMFSYLDDDGYNIGGKIMIKVSNCDGVDYIEQPLFDLGCGCCYDEKCDGKDHDGHYDILDRMHSGESVKIDTNYTTRAANYDKLGKFVVFSIDEIQSIYDRIGELLLELKK